MGLVGLGRAVGDVLGAGRRWRSSTRRTRCRHRSARSIIMRAARLTRNGPRASTACSGPIRGRSCRRGPSERRTRRCSRRGRRHRIAARRREGHARPQTSSVTSSSIANARSVPSSAATLLGAVDVEVGDDNARALGGESFGDGAPDARRGTGHERDPSGQEAWRSAGAGASLPRAPSTPPGTSRRRRSAVRRHRLGTPNDVDRVDEELAGDACGGGVGAEAPHTDAREEHDDGSSPRIGGDPFAAWPS